MNRKQRRALRPEGVSVKDRTMVKVQQEYVELCAKLGELELRQQINKDMLSKIANDKNTLVQAIGKLQKEYEAFQKAESEKPTEEKKDNALPFKEVVPAPEESNTASATSGT